jgi:hypothetical protein
MNTDSAFRSKIHKKIIAFFHENQASIDTPRGVATWIGEDRAKVKLALGGSKLAPNSREFALLCVHLKLVI